MLREFYLNTAGVCSQGIRGGCARFVLGYSENLTLVPWVSFVTLVLKRVLRLSLVLHVHLGFFFIIHYKLNCFLRKISGRLLAGSFKYLLLNLYLIKKAV